MMKRGPTKLTPEIVQAIKNGLRHHIEGNTLARLYGVTPSAISLIKHGKRWREVQ